jgi:hypothetical protein
MIDVATPALVRDVLDRLLVGAEITARHDGPVDLMPKAGPITVSAAELEALRRFVIDRT